MAYNSISKLTAEIIADWLDEPDNCGELAGLDYIDPEQIRRATPEKLPAMTALGRTSAWPLGGSVRRTGQVRLQPSAQPSPELRAVADSVPSALRIPNSALMQVTITAVGPDNRGLADPIIHYVTGQGANIAEIQMYDHDEECLFAMLLRIELARERYAELRTAMQAIGREKDLSIRVWSPDERADKPRLAICTTLRPETPLALLRADSRRPACRPRRR